MSSRQATTSDAADFDKQVDWQILRTMDQLEPLVRELIHQQMFAWDVETSGTSPHAGKRIIGHSFAWRRPSGQIASFYAPCRHKSCGMSLFDDLTQLDPKQLSKALTPALTSSALKIGHNISFDIQFARFDDIDVTPPVFDTMLAYRVLNENLNSYRLTSCLKAAGIPHHHGWKAVVDHEIVQINKFLRTKIGEFKNTHGHEYVPIDIEGKYSCQDSAYELMLGEYLQQCNYWPETTQLEMDLLWCCLDIQRIGVPLDSVVLERLREMCRQEMQELTPAIWTAADAEFEITNDNELRRILYEKFDLPVPTWTGGAIGKGQPKVDDDALWVLATQHNSELAKLLRKYRSFSKIFNTYTRSIAALTDEHGILHGEIRQSGARTGRVAMARPNLQNIPKRNELGRMVRRAFIARPGHIRYHLDFSQAEMRVLAHLSQDPTLLRIFHQGLDVHSTTAKEVFGTDGKVAGRDMRRIAKCLNFGAAFGITESGVLSNVNKDLPEGQPSINKQQAAEFLASFYTTYSGVARYRNRLTFDICRQKGEFVNLFGRPRRLPMIRSSERWERRKAERQAIATMVQGSAADLMKRVMLECWRFLKSQRACEAHLVLTIHDELAFDMWPEGSARTVRELRRIMESRCQHVFAVPIKVDCGYFLDNWSNKQPMENF